MSYRRLELKPEAETIVERDASPAVVHHEGIERLVTGVETAAAEARRERAKAQHRTPPTSRAPGQRPGEDVRFSLD